MPTRLKLLIVAFVVFAFTNAATGAFLIYWKAYPNWLSRAVLSYACSGAYLVCAYSIWEKKKEARWLSPVLIGVLMALTFGPSLYSLATVAGHHARGGFFAPERQMYFFQAAVYLFFGFGAPALVRLTVSSEIGKSWLSQ